jgi:RND family efflux transporter MFP subunit
MDARKKTMKTVSQGLSARRLLPWVTGLAATLLIGAAAVATEIEGFTEPYKEIEVAAAETGIIRQLHVQEGDRVSEGDVLATLDRKVLEVSLEIAASSKEARGQLNSAEAELRLRAERLRSLEALRQSQHASEEEVIRATEEKEVAEGNLLAVQEVLQVKELEFDRIKAQLDRRQVRSPIGGVVSQIYKDVGEFVAPTEPIVLTVVQLDPLLATFSVPAPEAYRLTTGQKVTVKVGFMGKATSGTVDFVSPVINAQSGTVTVKVQLPNASGQFRSGDNCRLLLKKASR